MASRVRPTHLNLAQVVTTVGVCGELKVRPETDDPLRLKELTTVTALLRGGEREVLTLERVYLRGNGVLIVKFQGYDDPESAARLRQAWLQIRYTEAKRSPGKILYADVLGLRVVDDLGGQVLGEVRDVLRAAQDLLEVVTPAGREVLVPWVDEFVKTIDLDEGIVRVNCVEGLFND